MVERYATPRLSVVDREAYVVRASIGKRVLHLGCADAPLTGARITSGTLLHAKLTAVARECLGIDVDLTGLSTLRANGFMNVLHADVESLGSADLHGKFDVVIAGEILEHLSSPGRCLLGLRAVLAPGGTIVITVPNAFTLKGLVRVALGAELIHRDHVCYFSARTLTHLCEANEFECSVIGFYSHRPRGLLKRSLEAATFGMIRAVAPQLSEGLIACARLRDGHVDRSSQADARALGMFHQPTMGDPCETLESGW
jgi:2-polyprenyl-3-methyl-5-hydroxy-6-metoxy-1,4-benzoquinol methylase